MSTLSWNNSLDWENCLTDEDDFELVNLLYYIVQHDTRQYCF
jgi:hypothetical protein